MTASTPTLSDRLHALLDRLHLPSAHFATQMPVDLADFAAEHGERIASVTFAVPARLDPAPFAAIGDRVEIVTGDSGVSFSVSQRAAERLEGARLKVLERYATTGWCDLVRDRTGDVVAALAEHCERHATAAPAPSAPLTPRSGTHAGISFQIEGAGPPLVLMPFFLAPSQWDPALEALKQRFTVIRIGGAHIGGIAMLETRASAPTYRAMFGMLTDLLAVPPGGSVLEVGCGSGVLARMLAHRMGPQARITALDLNGYLLREAKALAVADGLEGRIAFVEGSAEHLPFPDASFDCAYSVTVLEECDADRAIGELKRVVRPGGRIGIVVRAIDVKQWWHLDLDADLRAKADVPPQSVGAGGVADGSLYDRMQRAGLVDLVPFPALITLDKPGTSIWRYREDHLVSLLDAAESARWAAARAKADARGLLFQAHALHCAVATKPRG